MPNAVAMDAVSNSPTFATPSCIAVYLPKKDILGDTAVGEFDAIQFTIQCVMIGTFLIENQGWAASSTPGMENKAQVANTSKYWQITF